VAKDTNRFFRHNTDSPNTTATGIAATKKEKRVKSKRKQRAPPATHPSGLMILAWRRVKVASKRSSLSRHARTSAHVRSQSSCGGGTKFESSSDDACECVPRSPAQYTGPWGGRSTVVKSVAGLRWAECCYVSGAPGLKYVPGSGHAGERPGTCTCT
jgi:hypothetical protein